MEMNEGPIIEALDSLLKRPDKFFAPESHLDKTLADYVKAAFDSAQKCRLKGKELDLPLILERMDTEQVWQQVEIENRYIPDVVPQLAKLLVQAKLYGGITGQEEEESPLDSEEEDEEGGSDLGEEEENGKLEEEEGEEVGDQDEGAEEGLVKKEDPLDVFKKLYQVEDQLDEKNDDIDFFSKMPQANEENAKFDDFFPGRDPSNVIPRGKEGEDDESDKFSYDEGENRNIASTLEKRKKNMKAIVETFEEEMLNEKPWQLKGQVSAATRPLNSLLEEAVEFDISQRPAPIITEETTERLEDIIIRRIRDRLFDDVVRKIRLTNNVQPFKKKIVLDQEKSKQSLAEIYEQEYVTQKKPLIEDESEKPEEVSPEKEEINKMMDSLFAQLDALSNYHFTPVVTPEVQIISNAPAVAVEEVAPITSTDASMLAPEEVGPKFKRVLLSKDERSKTDKKRERRRKKKHQTKVLQENEKKMENQKDRSSETNKQRLKKLLKSSNVSLLKNRHDPVPKSSTNFFNTLQDNTSSQDKLSKKVKKKRNVGDDQPHKSAKHFKL